MITQEKLKELLEYDQETGNFIWKKSQGTSKKGNIAGSNHSNGYKKITLFNKVYLLHRLAVLYVTGYHPINEVDHINGIKTDNRISNLRDVSRSANQQNRSIKYKSNKSGFLGVVMKGKKYRAQISVNGKTIQSIVFKNAEDAHEEYKKMKRFHHGENCMI